MMTPDAEPDDGLFDVVLIKDTKPEVVRELPRSTRARIPPPGRPRCCGVASSRSRRRIRCPCSSTASSRHRPVRFEIAPPRLLRVPAARRLLGGALARGRARRAVRVVFGFALGFWSSASCFSSLATRFSSSSRPRTFFWTSSIRSRSPLTLPTTSAVVCELATSGKGALALVGELAQDVLLLLCHGGTLPGRGEPCSRTWTGVPVGASRQSRLTVRC